MCTLTVPFIISRTTPTRNVKGSKWNLLKRWELKTLNFGNVLKNIYIYSIKNNKVYISEQYKFYNFNMYLIKTIYITNNKVFKSQTVLLLPESQMTQYRVHLLSLNQFLRRVRHSGGLLFLHYPIH